MKGILNDITGIGTFGSQLGGPNYSFGFPWGGDQFPQQGYDFRFMYAERIAYGYEPIVWPKIICNHFRAISLTRPLTIIEKLLFDGAVQAVKEAQNEQA